MARFQVITLCCLLAAAIAFAQSRTAAAQGHFCARYDDDATPEDCSFTSFQMCQQAISGLGGICAPGADSPTPPPPPLFQLFPTQQSAFPSAPVPPPPDMPYRRPRCSFPTPRNPTVIDSDEVCGRKAVNSAELPEFQCKSDIGT